MKKINLMKIIAMLLVITTLAAFAVTGYASEADAAGSAEADAAETYSDEVESVAGRIIRKLDDMEVGETDEKEFLGYTSTTVKPQEDLVVTHAVDTDTEHVNSELIQFAYRHGENYQIVQFLTRASDGVETIVLMDVSADGQTVTPIYASTNDDSIQTTTLEMSDILQGETGYIDITATENEDGSVHKVQNICSDDGKVVAVDRTDITKTEDAESVWTIVLKDDVAVANIDFEKTVSGNTESHSVKILDQDSNAEITYDIVDGEIDLDSAALTVIDSAEEYAESSIKDDIFLLGRLHTGDTVTAVFSDTSLTRTKISDDLILTVTEGDAISSYSFIYSHGDGYQCIARVTDKTEGFSTMNVLDISADGKTITPIYFSNTYAIDGTDTIKPYAGSETTAEFTTVENDDGTTTKTAALKDEDGNTVMSFVAELIKNDDGVNTSSTTELQNGNTVMVDYVLAGDSNLYTISDDDATTVLSYDVADGAVLVDSIEMTID